MTYQLYISFTKNKLLKKFSTVHIQDVILLYLHLYVRYVYFIAAINFSSAYTCLWFYVDGKSYMQAVQY